MNPNNYWRLNRFEVAKNLSLSYSKFHFVYVMTWLFILLLLNGCKEEPKQNVLSNNALKPSQPIVIQPPKGKWITSSRETMLQNVPAIGSLYAKQVTKLGPQVSGRVNAIYVEVGDLVKTGQVLVALDSKLLEIELAQRKADYALACARLKSLEQSIKSLESEIVIAKNSVEDANLQLSRMKVLWDGSSSSIARKQYDDAIFQHRQAKVTLELQESRLLEAHAKINEANCAIKQAEEAISYAQQRLSETKILAPYDGVITSRLVHTGEPATSGPVVHVIEIQEISTLKLEFTLPQNMLEYIYENMPIEFEVEGLPNSTTKGKIDTIFPMLDEATRSIRCRAFIKNQNLRLKPGMLVRVTTIKELKNILTVPRHALIQAHQDWQIWTYQQDKPLLQKVKVGLINETQAEIKEGLVAGAKVLVLE